MIPLPYTAMRLMRNGYDAEPLLRAARAAFSEAETAPVRTIQNFWDRFVEAHVAIYRGGAMQEAA